MHSWKIARVKEKYMSGIYWGIYAEYCAATIRWSLWGSAAMIDSAGGGAGQGSTRWVSGVSGYWTNFVSGSLGVITYTAYP